MLRKRIRLHWAMSSHGCFKASIIYSRSKNFFLENQLSSFPPLKVILTDVVSMKVSETLEASSEERGDFVVMTSRT